MNRKCMTAILLICMLAGLAGCQSKEQVMEANTEAEVRQNNENNQEEQTEDENEPEAQVSATVYGPDGSIGMTYLDDWDYEPCLPGTEGFFHDYGFRVTSKDKGGSIDLGYDNSFGVCGTGLKEKEVTIAGVKANAGYYDDSSLPAFVVFHDEMEGLVATIDPIPNVTEEEIFDILDTLSYDEKDKRLPSYMYQGGDGKMEAIIDYLRQDSGEQGEVWIPSFLVLKEEYQEDNNTMKVYGNFWYFFYSIKENSLYCESGGEQPGVITLSSGDDGWKVTEAEFAGDGSMYEEDIHRFCQGDKELEKAYYDSSDAGSQKVRMQRMDILTDYVTRNGLKMDSYQDYGWDPVYFKDGEDLIGNKDLSLLSGIYLLEENPSEFPDFSLSLSKDGTFTLYESPISSYIYRGHYEIKDDCYLVLKEDMEGQKASTNTFLQI